MPLLLIQHLIISANGINNTNGERETGGKMEKPYYLFTPMRVFLISSSADGIDNFMPATWCFPLSAEPQMYGVAVAKKRFTYGLIHKSREFVINIPGEGLLDAIEKYGRVSGREGDKFTRAGVTREKSEKVNACSIAECLSSIEYELVDEYETGDHVVMVGRAVNIKIRCRLLVI